MAKPDGGAERMTLTRRDFGWAVVSTAGWSAVAAEQPSSSTEKNPDPLIAEAAAWLESIRARYPDERLTPDVLKQVATDVLGDIQHCRRISGYPLKNSDAPAFAMSVWTEGRATFRAE
jgi:hypothetical protein